MSWADAAAIVGGLGAGVLSGLVGIGGGQVFVPLLTLGFGTTQVVAQGTSLVAIVPTALVGGASHVRHRTVQLGPALWVGASGVLGAVAGALIAVHSAGALLARIFGALLIISAVLMWRRAASSTPAASPGEDASTSVP